jgi:predicted metal-binding protein
MGDRPIPVNDLQRFADFALAQGATTAKVIDAVDVVVDKRVRMKCEIPICSGFNTYLMCPPNVMPVEEFREVLKGYKKALLLQVEADVDSSAKSEKGLTKAVYKEMAARHNKAKRKLHDIVNAVEAEAFKAGHYLATGLVGGRCVLCKECVLSTGSRQCRNPHKARPSLESVGIDVHRTCENAGMKIRLSSSENVRWTGLVLLS